MPILTLGTWIQKALARKIMPAHRQRLRLDELERRVNPANPYLVADINTVAASAGSNPANYIDVNGTAFFKATDPVHGEELWKSDGTQAGTVMIKDIFPGSGGSTIQPYMMAAVNGTLFFTAQDGDHAIELWKSDGTEAGTVMVKDINPGFASSAPTSLINFNGTLFFACQDGVNGGELWKSDGTEAGTVMVKDISPGSGNSSPNSLRVVNDTLYFMANDGVNGGELWKTDGTTAGTVMVKDIRPGSSGSNPSWLTNVNGTLYFRANDGVTGYELWKSDGTADGTVLVKDIRSGSQGSSPAVLTNVQGTLYFSATDGSAGYELWKSDGTEAGTVLVKDISPGSAASGVANLTAVNGTLLFKANDGTNGHELWKSDGTTAGTVMVKDINPGASGSNGGPITAVNGTVFFTASDGATGQELWKSDGTAAGTVLVKDIRPTVSFNGPTFLTAVGATLFFTADNEAIGPELWKSDGTAAGTVMVKDILAGTAPSTPRQLTDVNGTLFFVADNGVNGQELWKSDGTAAGTAMVKDIRPGVSGSSISSLTNLNGTLFFAATDGTNGIELWKSDGSTAGTMMVKNIRSGSADSSPADLTVFNGAVYFAANNGTNGIELWKSDGTDAGTVLIKDVRSGSGSGLSGTFPYLEVMGGTLYFRGDDGATGSELWKSDGTTAGTGLVLDIWPGSTAGDPLDLRAAGSTLYFYASDSTHGRELWKSDGTAAGTVMVKDMNPGATTSLPQRMTAVGGSVFLVADNGTNGRELWTSDGTEAGTFMVKDILPGLSSTNPSNLLGWNGALYFSASDSVNGTQLWRSDGTTAGTLMVQDGAPGTKALGPAFLTLLNDTLYFSALDRSSGAELWASDGTGAATVRVGEIVPGSGSSSPNNLAAAGGRLFFAATTEAAGQELWAFDPVTGPTVSFTTGAQSAAEGSGTMTVTVQLSAVTDQTVTVPFTLSGTATDGPDYTMTASPITIPAGSLTGSATITIVNDGTDEPDETVVVTMGVPTNADAGGTTVHTATILDDDSAPTVSFTTAGGSAAEGVATRTATISLSAASALTVTVPFSVSGTATDPDDYSIAPVSPLVFAPGETSKTVTITVVDDSDVEPEETVVLTLGAPTNATLGETTTYTEAITDDDLEVTVSFTASGGSAAEGVVTRTTTVALSEPAPFTVTVPYTVGGTANNPADYTMSPASPLTFEPGETTQTITITVADDADHEADETVVLTLGTPTNATLGGTTTYTETIVNDDAAPAVAFSSSSGSASENVPTRTVTVQLSGPSTLPITVPYSVGGTATSPDDYTISPASPLTFAPGETSKTITITVVDDSLIESDETVVLALGTPTNGTLGSPAVYTETILEDFGITVSPPSATFTTEGGGTVTFVVVLTAIPTADVIIPVASSDSTEGTTSVSQLVFTAANAAVPQTVTITGLDDATMDFNQAYSVLLGPVQSDDPRFNGLDPADLGLVNVEFFGTRRFVDTDGDKFTVTLAGPGQVGVIQTPSINGPGSIDRIVLSPAVNPLRSRLTVSVVKMGNGLVDIGTVSGGGLLAFTAAKSDLIGAGALFDGYVGRLQVRDIENGADIIAGGPPTLRTAVIAVDVSDGTTIDLGSGISTLRVARFGEGRVAAPRIGTLSVTGNLSRAIPGDFEADVRLTGLGVPALAQTLGSMVVADTIRGSAIEVAGHAGSVRTKAMIDSSLLLGLDGTVLPGFKLRTFAATGFSGSPAPAFVDSTINADQVGRVTLKSVATNHPDQTFGVTAMTSLVALKVVSPPFLYNLSAPSPQGLNLDQDVDLEFVVRVG